MHTNTKNFIQMCCLPFALLTNLSLFILILTRSPPKLGNYKYLMAFFSFVSSGFSALGALVNPHLISTADCFVVASKVQFEDAQVDRVILYYGCAACGIIMSMFVVHFIYRFFAVQRRGNLKYFEKWWFPCWIAVPLITGFVWAQINFIFMHEDKETSDYIREIVENQYSTDMNHIVYNGMTYYHKNWELNWNGLYGVIILGSIMTICFVLILYFGTLTYYRIKHLIIYGMSEFTKRLQKQLYYALVLQTIIPIFFLILPLTFFFFLPFFHLGYQLVADVATIYIAIYPIIDPLPVIFVIDNYRSAIFELFGVKPEQRQNAVNCENSV